MLRSSTSLFRTSGSAWVEFGDLTKPLDATLRFPSLTAALEAMREHFATR